MNNEMSEQSGRTKLRETTSSPDSNEFDWFSSRTKMILLTALAATSTILVVLLSIITYFYVQRGYLFYPRVLPQEHHALFDDDFHMPSIHGGYSELDLPKTSSLSPDPDAPSENELVSLTNSIDPDKADIHEPATVVNFIKMPSNGLTETALEETVGGGIKGPTAVDSLFDDHPKLHETNSNDEFRAADMVNMNSDKEEFRAFQNVHGPSEIDKIMETPKPESSLVEPPETPTKALDSQEIVSEMANIEQASAAQTADTRAKVKTTTKPPPISPRRPQEALKSSKSPEMKLFRVPNAVPSGAVCLDGSAPAYYHRPGIGNSAKLWIIHFNGGAWCFDPQACLERSKSSLGSTKNLPPSPPIVQGINSPDPSVNPDFYDWNLVWIVYCDGASFTGNREKPLVVDGHLVYLRGKRVLNAILNDLLQRRDLRFAEAVILTGSSAGSMTAMFQADYIASRFPKTTPVRVLSDAGFFLETSPLGGKNIGAMFKAIYDMQNSSSGLDQDCVKQIGASEGWQCFLPARAFKYIKTPMFILNSAYDFWALLYFLGIDCKFPAASKGIKRKRSVPSPSSFLTEFAEDVTSLRNIVSTDILHRHGTISPTYFPANFKSRRKRDISGFEILPFFRKSDEQRLVINRNKTELTLSFDRKRRRRDISGFEMFPFFRKFEELRSVVPESNENDGHISTLARIYQSNITTENREINRTTRNVSEVSGKPTSRKNITSRRDVNDIRVHNDTVEGDNLKRLMDELNGSQEVIIESDEKKKTSSQNSSLPVHDDDAGPLNATSPKITEVDATIVDNSTVSSITRDILNATLNDTSTTHNTSHIISPITEEPTQSSRNIPSTSMLKQAALAPVSSKASQFNSSHLTFNSTHKKVKNISILGVEIRNKTEPPAILASKVKLLPKHHVEQTGARRSANSSSPRSDRLKNRRSTSIAREYINILRSDPPECTEKEILRAMAYRGAIITATDAFMKLPKSGRFLVSCIDHSLSLFDETWTGLLVNGQSIQQVFGDWFYERGTKAKYNFVDCPWPCNPSCP